MARAQKQLTTRVRASSLTGSDGRQPFTPEEEAAILAVLRVKRVWPAFAGTNVSIGCKGFRSSGFHEKARMPPSSISTAAKADGPPAKKRKRAKQTFARLDRESPPSSPSKAVASTPASVRPSTPGTADLGMLDDILELFSSPPVLRRALAPEPSVPDAKVLEDESDAAFKVGLKSLLVGNNLEPVAASPSPDTVRNAAKDAVAELDGPNRAVLIVNANATGFDSLFVAQNARSVGLVGAIAGNVGGHYRPIVSHAQLLAVLRHARFCAANPGIPVSLPVAVTLATGEAVTLNVEAKSVGNGLFAFTAHLLGET